MRSKGASVDAQRLSASQVAEALGVDRSPSDLVRINPVARNRIADHIASRPDFDAESKAMWDDFRFWNVEASPQQRSQYFAVGTAINFRFWRLKGDAVHKARGTLEGQTFHGAMYMWRALRLAVNRSHVPLLDPVLLASITEEQFDIAFSDDTGHNPLAVGKADRLANLRDFGRQLTDHWGGDFYNLVTESAGSVVTFARLSRDFRAFDDPLLKLTMLNVILHSGSGIATFHDKTLPAIDYHLVKQLLRQAVLEPEVDLARKLANQALLEPDEALELRRAALAAFLEISERTGLSGEILDNRYWWNRLKCRTETPVCLDPATARECPFYGACAERIEFGIPLERTRYY